VPLAQQLVRKRRISLLQIDEASSNKFDLTVVLMTKDPRVTAVLRLFQPNTLDGETVGRLNVMNTSGGKRLVAR